MLEDYDVWGSLFHQYCSTCLLWCIVKMFLWGCLNFRTLAFAWILPFMFRIQSIAGEPSWAVNPLNLSEKNVPVRGWLVPENINLFIKSKSFQEKLDLKESANKQSNKLYKELDYQDVNKILKDKAIKFWILSGEADYVNPVYQIQRNIDVDFEFEGKDQFAKAEPVKGEFESYRESENFRWTRKQGGGACIWNEDPQWYATWLIDFIEAACEIEF